MPALVASHEQGPSVAAKLASVELVMILLGKGRLLLGRRDIGRKVCKDLPHFPS